LELHESIYFIVEYSCIALYSRGRRVGPVIDTSYAVPRVFIVAVLLILSVFRFALAERKTKNKKKEKYQNERRQSCT